MASQQILNRGGKKAKRMKKRVDVEGAVPTVFPESPVQDYAVVTKVRGGGRYTVMCLGDKKPRIALKRGALTRGPNRAIIFEGDLLIVSLREFQPTWCDVIHKYSLQHSLYLCTERKIPSSTEIEKILRAREEREKTKPDMADDDDDDTGFDFSTI